ncbi:helix-turn-helix domain-containing protein [Flavobacteriaceae bacterium AU392]|nr:AraC family transcriptional regulator [Flavobacteriaceae bacterium]RKM85986.1 helix-turn-helix domain-containing protein [Flavobacteriaceae bacterium AU392]
MYLNLNFNSIFSFLAIGQGLFLFLFILLKHIRNRSYVLLACILIPILFELIHSKLISSRLILEYPYFVSTGHLFSYSIGPFIYLYTFSLTKKDVKFRWYQVLHFIPFIIYNINKLPSYLQTNAQKTSFLRRYYKAIDSNPQYFTESRGFLDIMKGFLLFDLHKIIYIIAAFYIFYNFRKKIKNRYSNLEKTNLKWIHNILYGYLIIWIMIPIQRFHVFLDIDPLLVHNIESLILSIHIYLIAYMVFSQKSELKLHPIQKPKSLPDTKRLENILRAANEMMIEEKLFLNQNLSLSMLAQKVDAKEHNLSKTINDSLGINFFDYVNNYRVEEAKKLLQSQNNKLYTVEHIGALSGFSSKTTFYRAFKKQTGMTPSKFQKNN